MSTLPVLMDQSLLSVVHAVDAAACQLIMQLTLLPVQLLMQMMLLPVQLLTQMMLLLTTLTRLLVEPILLLLPVVSAVCAATVASVVDS